MDSLAIVAFLVVLLRPTRSMASKAKLTPDLAEFVESVESEFESIPSERRDLLSEISQFVEGRIRSGKEARLVFICTHNSRRSHLAQIWAHTAAGIYGVPKVKTYSGGTEATAFNPSAVGAVERAGFLVMTTGDSDNPKYEVRYGQAAPPMVAFSKIYSDRANPHAGFCAVMTCSDADENCPVVHGAETRVAIPYEDPKAFDGTPEEAAKYDERCRQIAREMLWVFSVVSGR